MLLKMLYKIRPVQDRGLLLVRSLPVAVRSFGQSEYIRTGPGPGLCLQEQKTGPDQTFKHYFQVSPPHLHFFNELDSASLKSGIGLCVVPGDWTLRRPKGFRLCVISWTFRCWTWDADFASA